MRPSSECTDGAARVPAADHSVFVGDLAPDVTDYMLQEHFRQYYSSVRSAKVSCLVVVMQLSVALSFKLCHDRLGL